MSVKSLDLSKKADFLLATGSSVATVAQLFGKNPAEWDIDEASYNNVPFHVFKSKVSWGGALPTIRDQGGRRLAKFKFPYKDGQTTDDLGREGETFECDIVLFGETYVAGLKILMRELQKPEPGLLVHPVRGVIRCKMQSYELVHSHEQRKAVQLKITFTEHNFTLASYGKIANVKNFKSRLSDLLGVFNAISKAITKVRAAINLLNSIKATIEQAYESFQAAFLETTVSMNQVFNRGASTDIPSLVPVNQGGVLKPDGTLATTNFPSAVNPDDPFRNVPVAQLQAAIAARQALFASQQYESTGALDGTTGEGFQTLANLSAAVAAIVVQNQINSCRVLADQLIKTLEAARFNAPALEPLGTDSDGSLEFYNEILDVKRSVILLQEAYELGSAQAQAGVRRYVVPRLMSVREAAFLNGLDPERAVEIDLLNPELESLNHLEPGTEVLVPV